MGGIFFVAPSPNKVWLRRQVAEIIIKTAGPGILPVDNLVDKIEAALFVVKSAQVVELVLQPNAVVERQIDRVEVRAAPDPNRLISPHAELHTNALKEGFGELEHPCTPIP
jgi:hypothetical protein